MEFNSVKQIGLDPAAPVGRETFQRLLAFLTAIMQIDSEHILTTLAWAETNRFEMTDAMAAQVMQVVFLKEAGGGQPDLLEQPVRADDFARMAKRCKLVDKSGKEGIPQARL